MPPTVSADGIHSPTPGIDGGAMATNRVRGELERFVLEFSVLLRHFCGSYFEVSQLAFVAIRKISFSVRRRAFSIKRRIRTLRGFLVVRPKFEARMPRSFRASLSRLVIVGRLLMVGR